MKPTPIKAIFEDISPVPTLNPVPRWKKKTAAVLTDKEHLNQAKLRRQKAAGLKLKCLRQQTAITMPV
jgi:hypothetical protein